MSGIPCAFVYADGQPCRSWAAGTREDRRYCSSHEAQQHFGHLGEGACPYPRRRPRLDKERPAAESLRE